MAITATGRLDFLRTPGEEVLKALVSRIYDVDLVMGSVTYTVNTDPQGIKQIVLTAGTDGVYYGETRFSYQGISGQLSGLPAFVFVLPLTLPVTAAALVAAIKAQYGIVFDIADLAVSPSTVLTSTYGILDMVTRSESLRFVPQTVHTVVVPVETQGLAGLVPGTAGTDLGTFGEIVPPSHT